MPDHGLRRPRPLTLDSRLRLGRCFRTDADGRIPLVNDWSTLGAGLRRAGRLVIQTRHTAARLIAVAPFPALDESDPRTIVGRDETGALHLASSHLQAAWGALQPCSCCRSPARIQVANAQGGAFLHLSALPDAEPDLWSAVFTDCLPATPSTPTLPNEGSSFHYLTLAKPFQRVAADPESLVTLLEEISRQQLPLICTLRTAEACHQRALSLLSVAVEGPLLSAGEYGARFQLAFPALRAFARTTDSDGSPILHLLGNHDALLLTLSADDQPAALASWAELLALHLS